MLKKLGDSCRSKVRAQKDSFPFQRSKGPTLNPTGGEARWGRWVQDEAGLPGLLGGIKKFLFSQQTGKGFCFKSGESGSRLE